LVKKSSSKSLLVRTGPSFPKWKKKVKLSFGRESNAGVLGNPSIEAPLDYRGTFGALHALDPVEKENQEESKKVGVLSESTKEGVWDQKEREKIRSSPMCA